MSEKLVPPIHGPDHAPGGPDPIPLGDAIFEIKVFEDDELVVAGDGKFKFAVPEDLDGAVLAKAEAWVTGASSSGTILVSLFNNTQGQDLLATELSIDPGELNSKTALIPHEVDEATSEVAWGDELWINVDNAGSGALGLGVAVFFISAGVGAIVLEGAKGDPGGITEYEGDWSGSSVSYPAGSVVVNNGVAYFSTVDHSSSSATEPGVGVDWETVWAQLVDIPTSAALSFNVLSSSGPIPDGVKAVALLPFAATILHAMILANTAGDVEVDIWRVDFAGYPPGAGDSICGGSPPTLVGSVKNFDSTLTGWTTSLADGDLLAFYVSGAVGIGRLTVALRLEREV